MHRPTSVQALLISALLCQAGVPSPALAATGKDSAKPSPAAAEQAPAPPASAVPAKPGDYSQQPWVVEQMVRRDRYESDGTGVREFVMRIRLQNQAGVQQYSHVQIPYDSETERVDVHYLRVRKPDGTVLTAPAEQMRDLTAPVARVAPLYSGLKFRDIVVPALQPGDVLEYDVATVILKSLVPGQFAVQHDFLTSSIVLDERLEVDVPAGKPLKMKTQPGHEARVEERDGRRIYRWSSRNLEIESEAEKAKGKKDGNKGKKATTRKNDPDARPDVQMSTFQSWEQVGAAYAALQADRIAPNDAVRAKAAELTKGRTDDVEKVHALYDYVATQFRYVSLSFGVGMIQPHAAGEVLANGYGDCKDKHTLLAALLKSAGLPVEAALIHSSRTLDESMPSLGQFDHVITAVPLKGRTLWMDTTTEIAPFQFLTASLRGKKALLVPEQGPAHLETTPATPSEPNREDATVTGSVDATGRLTADVHVVSSGDEGLGFRFAFRSTAPNRWKDLAEYVDKQFGLAGEVSDVHASDPMRTDAPFDLTYKVATPNYLSWSSRYSELKLPLHQQSIVDLSDVDEDSDKPIKLRQGPMELHTALTLKMPASLKLRLPLDVDVRRDYAEYHAHYSSGSGTLRADWRHVLSVTELPHARLEDARSLLRTIGADVKQTVGVENEAAANTPLPQGMEAADLDQAGLNALHHGNPKEAAALFSQVVKLEPKHASAWNDLGLAYLGLRRPGEAIDAFRKQIEVSPYDAYAYNNLGRAYRWQGRYEEAIAAFKKQIEIDPLDEYAHANLGGLYVSMKWPAEALPELEKAVSIRPKNATNWVALGGAYLATDAKTKGFDALWKAMDLAESSGTWNGIAYALAENGMELDMARRYAESACATASAALRVAELDHLRPVDLQWASSLAAYWDTLGWVYFKRGDMEQAEHFIAPAWRLSLASEVGDHLGQLYEKQGRRQEAMHLYALASEAEFPTPEATKHLEGLAGAEAAKRMRGAAARELEAMRSMHVDKLPHGGGASAEFFVVLSPEGRAERVKFIGGSEALKPASGALERAQYGPELPKEWPMHIVRRGALSCAEKDGDCTFTMTPLDAARVD